MRYLTLVLTAIFMTMSFTQCASLATKPKEMASPEYRERNEMTESLFKDDQAVLSNEDIDRILTSKVTLPAKSKMAILRFGLRKEWSSWSEEFMRMDETKAFSTVEAVLLDVRTGIVVFSDVATETFATKKAEGEYSSYEAMQRAEQTAVASALAKVATDLTTFLNGVPVN